MKKLLLLIIAFLYCSTEAIMAQSNEEEAVKKTVRLAQESFAKNDSTTWRSLYVHDETTTSAFTTFGYYDILKGWKKFDSTFTSIMKQRGRPSIYSKVIQSDFDIKYSDKLAYLKYTQKVSVANDTIPPYITQEERILVKENNQWKISSANTVDTLSFKSSSPDVMEMLFNYAGYNFLNDKKINEAIEVFKFNVKMYPKAWNTYDSLGEAYAAAGNTDLAIKNYEISVRLNPKNDNGKTWIAKLKNK